MDRFLGLTFSQTLFPMWRQLSILFNLADAVPKPVNTLPSKETVTIQQEHLSVYEKSSTPVTPVQILDQNCIPPGSSGPENRSLEVSDTCKYHF